jgi:hypothetical protein
MVFFIPVLLVIAGVAIYKEAKDRKDEKRKAKAEAAASGQVVGSLGHGTVYYNRTAIDTKLSQADLSEDTPPAYKRLDDSTLALPAYSAAMSPATRQVMA